MRFTEQAVTQEEDDEVPQIHLMIQTFCLGIVSKILGSVSLNVLHAFYREIEL